MTIDLDTGRFNGSAWAEKVGWISFRGTGDVAYNVKVARFRNWAVPALGGLGALVLLTLLAGFGVFILRKAGA